MAEPWPILLLVRELGSGGCERDLTKIALGLDRTRFQPHVGCLHPDGFRAQELKAAGIPIVRFPVQSLVSRSALSGGRELGRYIRAHGITLVHSYDYPMNLFATPVARFFRVSHIVASQLSYRSLRTWAERQLLRCCDEIADVIVVNCKAMERHMVDDEKADPGRIYLCYNGVDTRVFYPAPGPRPPRLADASLVIGSVCVMRPEKRIDLLVEAFARLYRPGSGLKLLLVGGGPIEARLREQVRALGLTDCCHFEPATGNVAPWMRAMDIFVLPSSSEAFSNALLEAMACGCSVVGSRLGGTPELIDHGRRGLLFEPGNINELAAHLAHLIQHEDARHQFAAAAVRFAQTRLSVETAVDRMQTLYTSLLDGTPLS